MVDWSYSALMLTAVLVGIALTRRPQQSLRLNIEQRVAIGLGAFCGAMIAAKAPFALSDWPGLLSGAAWFSNGKTILFGLAGGYFGVEIAKWATNVRTKTGDSFAPGVAAAVAVGRLACYRAGCCYGEPTTLPWGVVFPTADTQPRHPTQLYEALFHALCAVVLYHLRERGVFRGDLIKLYFIAYFAYRFVTEWLRPEARLWWGLTGYQYSCVVLAGLFAWLWWRDAQRNVE